MEKTHDVIDKATKPFGGDVRKRYEVTVTEMRERWSLGQYRAMSETLYNEEFDALDLTGVITAAKALSPQPRPRKRKTHVAKSESL